jgi:hypothetical protein
MNINVENLVRSAVLLVVGLPLTMGLNSALGTADRLTTLAEEAAVESESEQVISELKGELTKPCIDYTVSKVDSRLEREAKNEIDEILGGDVSHKNICEWVL